MTKETPRDYQYYSSRVAGYVFNPLLVPPLAVAAIVAHQSGDPSAVQAVIVRSAILFLLFPVLFLFWLKASGRTRTLEIRDRDERFMPLMVGVGLAFVAIPVVAIAAGSAANSVAWYLSGLALTVVAATLITRRFKMSLHAAAYASFAATLFFLAVRIDPDPGAVFVIKAHLVREALIIAAVTGVARVRAGAHSWVEMSVGALFGFVTGAAAMALVEVGFDLPFLQ